jgi:hypothetical protein
MSSDIPTCPTCNGECVERTVQKNSANFGRKFWACSRRHPETGMKCDFMQWADGKPSLVPRTIKDPAPAPPAAAQQPTFRSSSDWLAAHGNNNNNNNNASPAAPKATTTNWATGKTYSFTAPRRTVAIGAPRAPASTINTVNKRGYIANAKGSLKNVNDEIHAITVAVLHMKKSLEELKLKRDVLMADIAQSNRELEEALKADEELEEEDEEDIDEDDDDDDDDADDDADDVDDDIIDVDVSEFQFDKNGRAHLVANPKKRRAEQDSNNNNNAAIRRK